MYSVKFEPKAKKQLDKLPNQDKERIIKVLSRLRLRPFSHIKKLVNSNYFCLRVGDYRILLLIKENQLIIIVIKLGLRKKIYNK